MKSSDRNWRRRLLGPLQQIGTDLGTVFLGAAAIFLVRAFPASNCSLCDEFDTIAVVASGGFFVVGMALRLISKSPDE